MLNGHYPVLSCSAPAGHALLVAIGTEPSHERDRERGLPICFATLRACGPLARTLNEIAWPVALAHGNDSDFYPFGGASTPDDVERMLQNLSDRLAVQRPRTRSSQGPTTARKRTGKDNRTGG